MAQRASDQITVVDLTDGYTVYLEKYAYIFNGNQTNAIADSTTCKVTAMVGPEVVACTVDLAAITKPAGITISKDNNTTSPTLTITSSTSFNAPGFISIPVNINGIVIVQTIAVSFAKTGQSGTPGVSSTLMGLKNEAQMIPTNSNGVTTSASTITVDFYGYVGANREAVTAVVGTLPSGLTVGLNNAGTTSNDGVLTLSVANGANFGGQDSGQVQITLACNGQTRVAIFAWSKAKAGKDGSDGLDAIILEIDSSGGLIFKNSQVATTLTAKVFKGGTLQTSAQVANLGVVKWYKDGSYLSGKDGLTLIVTAGQVDNRATYEARLEN